MESQAADSQASACPVNHESRRAWFSQAAPSAPPHITPRELRHRTAERPQQDSSWLSSWLTPGDLRNPTIPSRSISAVPSSRSTPTENHASPSACPVDHTSREAWLSQARQKSSVQQPPVNPSAFTTGPTAGCDSSEIDQTPPAPPETAPSYAPSSAAVANTSNPIRKHRPLSQDREISTIPRALPTSVHSGTNPSNNEQETAPSTSGNWIYPSESQFFTAMTRKNYSPDPTDIASIIPIHNAVNERAWQQILAWEKPYTSPSPTTTGPKLYSFKGLGSETSMMTPRARWNMLVGYQGPFDRHDWVVERQGGERVEYVIDFYQGKGREGGGGGLSFYLDVRPKLNSLEGWKMRASRICGLQ